MSLTSSQSQTFAKNLDELLCLLGMSRKDAAEQIGLNYKLIRRLVTAGISRPDVRNGGSLLKMRHFFVLPSILHFWQENLVDHLLASEEGRPFVEKFRQQLHLSRDAQVAKLVGVDEMRLDRLSKALEYTLPEKPGSAMPQESAGMDRLEKVKAILSSGEPAVQHFSDVIEAYYLLATCRLGKAG